MPVLTGLVLHSARRGIDSLDRTEHCTLRCTYTNVSWFILQNNSLSQRSMSTVHEATTFTASPALLTPLYASTRVTYLTTCTVMIHTRLSVHRREDGVTTKHNRSEWQHTHTHTHTANVILLNRVLPVYLIHCVLSGNTSVNHSLGMHKMTHVA